jgi:hypothetical protein
MSRTLELVDVSGAKPEKTGDTATLGNDGKVTYEGDGVRAIMSIWLAKRSPAEAFDLMNGWSNGYVSLQERK